MDYTLLEWLSLAAVIGVAVAVLLTFARTYRKRAAERARQAEERRTHQLKEGNLRIVQELNYDSTFGQDCRGKSFVQITNDGTISRRGIITDIAQDALHTHSYENSYIVFTTLENGVERSDLSVGIAGADKYLGYTVYEVQVVENQEDES